MPDFMVRVMSLFLFSCAIAVSACLCLSRRSMKNYHSHGGASRPVPPPTEEHPMESIGFPCMLLLRSDRRMRRKSERASGHGPQMDRQTPLLCTTESVKDMLRVHLFHLFWGHLRTISSPKLTRRLKREPGGTNRESTEAKECERETP